MKKFEWRRVQQLHRWYIESSVPLISLLEVRGNSILFWSALREVSKDSYSPIILNRTRSGYLTITDNLSLDESKEAVEKKLFDDGIIEDGDEVEDHTK